MFTNTSHDLDPSQCLAKTNASFLVGDAASTLTGCNTLASLHLQPGPHNEVNETKSFTYVSHSIKEFFSHIEKVPESFTNATALHLCADPQVQWTVSSTKYSTVHNHSQVFKPAHGSGPDALAQEIINNVTHIYFGSPLMFLGDPISAGYGACYNTRFDGEQGNRMHNLSKVHGGTGTNVTKQWSKVHHSDGITKLSMAGTMMLEFIEGQEFAHKDNAERALLSSQWHVQVLLALFLALFMIGCA